MAMRKLNRFLILVTACAFILSLGTMSAWADSISISLNNPNSAISGYTGPYGSVTIAVNPNSNRATITLTLNTVGGFIYLFGDGSTFAMNQGEGDVGNDQRGRKHRWNE